MIRSPCSSWVRCYSKLPMTPPRSSTGPRSSRSLRSSWRTPPCAVTSAMPLHANSWIFISWPSYMLLKKAIEGWGVEFQRGGGIPNHCQLGVRNCWVALLIKDMVIEVRGPWHLKACAPVHDVPDRDLHGEACHRRGHFQKGTLEGRRCNEHRMSWSTQKSIMIMKVAVQKWQWLDYLVDNLS